MGRHRVMLATVLASVVLSVSGVVWVAEAIAPANEHFQRTWERTDLPVAAGQAVRTWMWGPEAFTGELQEAYKESPGGLRAVQYFDKSRMEITNPDGDPSSIWHVTNGLLVVELITGRNQLGNDTFVQFAPASVNVAGDANDPDGPTYATFGAVVDADPLPLGSDSAPYVIAQQIDRQGAVGESIEWAGYGVATAYVDEVTNHTIAEPFWAFMNSSGTVFEEGGYVEDALFESPFFATGRPVTEAYWAEVQVGGTPRDVLIQCFERRCLTFTPDNAPEWRVESGNVGQHYHHWLYVVNGGGEVQGPCPDSDPGAYIYVADQFNDRVQKFDADGDFICAWGGDLPPESFTRPIGLKIGPDGFVYVLSSSGIHKYNHRGGFEGFTEIPVGGLDFAVTHSGSFVVPNVIESRIEIFDAEGNLVDEWGSFGTGEGQFDQPWGVAVDSDDAIYVVDHNNDRIQKFSLEGDFIRTFGISGAADSNTEFSFPIGVTVDDAGGLYVVDSGYVKMFGPQGGAYVTTGIWGGVSAEGFAGNAAIAVTTTGKMVAYVTDTASDQVRVFGYQMGANGAQLLDTVGSFGSAEGQFDSPVGIGVMSR